MKNLLLLVTATMPLVSFSMGSHDGDDKRTTSPNPKILGFLVDVIEKSDRDALAAVYGSVPKSNSFMQSVNFPRMRRVTTQALVRTGSEPVTQSELTRVLTTEAVDNAITDCNREHQELLFGVSNNPPKTLTRQTRTFHSTGASFEEESNEQRNAGAQAWLKALSDLEVPERDFDSSSGGSSHD